MQKQLLFLGHSNWYNLIIFHSHLKFITWNANSHLLWVNNNWPSSANLPPTLTTTSWQYRWLIYFQFVYTLFWFSKGIQNIDKMNVMASGWFVYGHNWMCVLCSGHGWNQWHITIWQFGWNRYNWGSIKFDHFAKVKFV